jgi:hypothetical protein
MPNSETNSGSEINKIKKRMPSVSSRIAFENGMCELGIQKFSSSFLFSSFFSVSLFLTIKKIYLIRGGAAIHRRSVRRLWIHTLVLSLT